MASDKASRSERLAAPTADGVAMPEPWNELVGHDETLSAWRQLVANDRLPPVILVTGRAGIGKRALLAALAAMHVCVAGTACGVCQQCRWLLAGAHPEILWLQSDKNERGEGKLLMEHAESLQDHLSLAASGQVRARVAVVVDADELTVQAANRLLKTLEETPDRTRVLLSTSRVDALPPTILSRCVRWRIAPPPVAAGREWLARRLAARGLAVPEPLVLERALKRVGLAPGLAWAVYEHEQDSHQGAASADGESLHWLTHGGVGRRSRGEDLVDADAWVKASGVGVSEQLARMEILLNEYYSSVVDGDRPSAHGVWQRRAILRESKALAMRGRVPLNAQLLAERLALVDVAGRP